MVSTVWVPPLLSTMVLVSSILLMPLIPGWSFLQVIFCFIFYSTIGFVYFVWIVSLSFLAGFDEYVSLLCSLPNIDPSTIKAATGGSCNRSFSDPSDLNLPSITISSLVGSRLVQRSVLNVGSKPEMYSCSVLQPKGVMVESYPSWFTIAPQAVQQLQIQLNVTQEMDDFSFGEIVLTGSLDHIVRIPLSFLPVSIS